MEKTMNPTIGVIGAMDIEVETLVSKLEDMKKTELYGCIFYSGCMYGRQVVILKSGVGKVNAARGTQLMIDRFSPEAILNTGIAGAIAIDLNVGDAVVATELVQHDFDTTAFGYAPGYMCNGIDPDKPTMYRADESLADKVVQAAGIVMTGSTVRKGIVATGDVFIAGAEPKRRIREMFNASAAEMEGAAIAQTASYAGVPFAVLRVMSDRADGSAPESYEEFEARSARLSAAAIEEFIKQF